MSSMIDNNILEGKYLSLDQNISHDHSQFIAFVIVKLHECFEV